MSEEEIESLNGYLEDLYQAMVIGDIVFEANHSLKLYNLIHKLLRENQKYKEEKRLILKDIKEWIACAKNEKLESDYIHKQYWDMFETILRKIFTKYNTENISDDDLKYNHYLEKENDELILENKKYKEIINKAIKYIEENKEHEYRNGNLDEYYLELNEKEMTELLDILKEVEHE